MKHLSTSIGTEQGYETLAVTLSKPYVYSVQLNRPKSLNALNDAMWRYVYLMLVEFLQELLFNK